MNTFKYAKVKKGQDFYLSNGRAHGEHFRKSIIELTSIRKNLLLNRNPALEKHLIPLALQQFDLSEKFSPQGRELCRELRGITEGAGISLADGIILNNYTDFRDLSKPQPLLKDEGCSTVYAHTKKGSFAGQTWDMHSSAKDYVLLIEIPGETSQRPHTYTFSVMGCLGLTGLNEYGVFVGINNLNTSRAIPGLIWPLLVRDMLYAKSFSQLKSRLLKTTLPKKTTVTSGHNYLIADKNQAEHWEVLPYLAQKVAGLSKNTEGVCFHTNHCLGKKIKTFEEEKFVSQTTHQRYSILEQKASGISDLKTLVNLLQDHEHYPNSLCSHFVPTGAKDPSETCGGVAYDFQKKQALFWKGCPKKNDQYSTKLISFSSRGIK